MFFFPPKFWKKMTNNFDTHFGSLQDPRIDRHKIYPLPEILFVILAGSICGAESWRDFVLFGNEKLDFLRVYYPFENGIPCKNTFARVLAALNPEKFRACFIEWVKSLQTLMSSVIAIDGKTLCNSADSQAGTSPIHMVSAFATEARLVLVQQKVDDKSNEITAIPKLLDLLDLQGHIVTIDAMGTQKAIAKQIIDQGGDYVLALKGNQGTLNEDVRLFLETEYSQESSAALDTTYRDIDKGHGRIEERICVASSQIEWLRQKEKWSGLKSLVMIEESREIKGRRSVERRFFISSLPADAKRLAEAVRAHWAVRATSLKMLVVIKNQETS